VEPGFRALKAAAFADHHPPEAEQHGGACTHRAGGEGGDQGELVPVASSAGIADALGFAMAGGIPVLHAAVVAAGHDRAVFLGEHRADRNAAFAPAQFGFRPGRLHQLQFCGVVHRVRLAP
jgi:hypothetical protein